MPKLVNCQQCGEPIPKGNKGWPTYRKRKYCSRQCSAKAQSKKQEVECLNCGEAMMRSPSHVHGKNFCDRECSKEYHQVTLQCEQCGQKFSRTRSALKDRYNGGTYNHHFCSHGCLGKWRRVDKEQDQGRRSPQDLEWKSKVIERDGYECRLCGTDRNLEAHHIKPIKQYPELRHEVQNGICVCHACHYYKIHGGRPNFIHGRYATPLDRGPVQLEIPV